MIRLCPWCIDRLTTDESLHLHRQHLKDLADQKWSPTVWYHLCTNADTPGHPTTPKYVLQDLPPNARS